MTPSTDRRARQLLSAVRPARADPGGAAEPGPAGRRPGQAGGDRRRWHGWVYGARERRPRPLHRRPVPDAAGRRRPPAAPHSDRRRRAHRSHRHGHAALCRPARVHAGAGGRLSAAAHRRPDRARCPRRAQRRVPFAELAGAARRLAPAELGAAHAGATPAASAGGAAADRQPVLAERPVHGPGRCALRGRGRPPTPAAGRRRRAGGAGGVRDPGRLRTAPRSARRTSSACDAGRRAHRPAAGVLARRGGRAGGGGRVAGAPLGIGAAALLADARRPPGGRGARPQPAQRRRRWPHCWVAG